MLSAAAVLALEMVMRNGHPGIAYNYGLLADAWLHGHSWISFPGPIIDAVPFHGLAYIVEAPAPAVLLLPLVPFFSFDQSQRAVANVLGAAIVFTTARLCARRGFAPATTIGVTAFAFFGTSLYTCATLGDVWFLAHVSAFCFSLLAIAECLGNRRPWLVAIYACFAAFSRYSLLSALPLYAIELWAGRNVRDAGRYVAALLPSFALSAWYDFVRWGTIDDPGYDIWFRVMDDRSLAGVRMFATANLTLQLRKFVYSAPTLSASFPFVIVSGSGFSLLWTSLPLVYALAARLDRTSILLWLATVATAIPAFLYYDTGQFQFGMRHALDFEPFLLALLVLALGRRPSRIVVVALYVFALFGIYEGSAWLDGFLPVTI